MSHAEKGTTTKRVSFLMPYIDFCFMLIIIFVGMLSIAYFDPVGRTDAEAKQPAQPNETSGENEIVPPGIEQINRGAGPSEPRGPVTPMEPVPERIPQPAPEGTRTTPQLAASGTQLVTRPEDGYPPLVAPPWSVPFPGQRLPAPQPGQGPNPQAGSVIPQSANPPAQDANNAQPPQADNGKGDISPEELKKLKDELEALKRKQGAGPAAGQEPGQGEGNNVYLDLRSGKK